jgi:Zn-dependent peptidase ImmA (M78 family)
MEGKGMNKVITLYYSDNLPGTPLMRRIERFALADRETLGCRFGEPCDPRKLIELYDVIRILETINDYQDHYKRSLNGELKANWSGVTMSLHNGEHLILINPYHSQLRRTFTIAHEFGHLVFSHQPIWISKGATLCTRYSDEQELEAHGYGLAVLLPYASLLQMVRQGVSIANISHYYGVSVAAVAMRLKITGLWDLLS